MRIERRRHDSSEASAVEGLEEAEASHRRCIAEGYTATRLHASRDHAGEIEGETSDGEVRRFGPGRATLVEDTTGKGHRSQVVGDTNVLLGVVQLPSGPGR